MTTELIRLLDDKFGRIAENFVDLTKGFAKKKLSEEIYQ